MIDDAYSQCNGASALNRLVGRLLVAAGRQSSLLHCRLECRTPELLLLSYK